MKLIYPCAEEMPDFAEEIIMVEVVFPGERKCFSFDKIVHLDGEKKILVIRERREQSTPVLTHFLGLPLVVHSRPKIKWNPEKRTFE
jgi:hypothetical protein